MRNQLHASIAVELAPDALAQAQQIQEIAVAWNAFLGGIISTKGDISLAPTLIIGPIPVEKPIRRRRGRPRLVGHATLATSADNPSAA